ncbi:thermonuclease family protein [Conyzicola sp.]|uniref:thermonuclease family protein n=1 Tax=Conyzicola sp. TaxID=1969404 RepID=UPI003988A610
MMRMAALLAATALVSGCAQTGQTDPGRVATPTIEMPADATSATVNYVHDGDTLFLTTPADPNLKVRLVGIDTPEIGDDLECYGDEATALLRELLPEGAPVFTQQDAEPEDQYGRSLLYLFTADGTSVNLEMVARGAAEAVRIGENDAYWDQLSSAESIAVESQAGIWGAC